MVTWYGKNYFSEVFDQNGNNKANKIWIVYLTNVNHTVTILNLCVIVEKK